MIAESMLSKRLETFEASLPEGIKLAYLPTFNTVKLRLTRIDSALPESQFNLYFQQLLEELGSDVFCMNDQDPAQAISRYLLSQGITFSTAESCTGGYIAHRLMQESGISQIFPGSMVAYANEIKQSELGVDPLAIQQFGAVSEAVAEEMARGICKKFKVELGISTTGIAGPGGLVYVGVCWKGAVMVKKFRMFGNREQIIHRTANAAFALIKQMLQVEVLP
jgi:nicotinamide-nucleotide amidase